MEQVKSLLETLKGQRAEVDAKMAPLVKRREQLQKKLQPLEDEMRDINTQVKALQGDELVALDKQISTLTRAIGSARVLQADSQS
jgi:uncharacterized protein YlxW (UPF0749 family)